MSLVDLYRGFLDFVTTPIRLWRLNAQCVQYAKKNQRKNLTGIREQQAQRLRELQQIDDQFNQIQFNSIGDDTEDAGLSQTSSSLTAQQPQSRDSLRSSSNEPQIGIFRPLIQMWSVNATLFALVAFLLTFTPMHYLVNYMNSWRVVSLLGMLFTVFFRVVMFAFTETVTFIFLKKIIDQIATLSAAMPYETAGKQTQQPAHQRGGGVNILPFFMRQIAMSTAGNGSIGGSMVDRLTAILFYSFYDIELRIVMLLIGSGHGWACMLSAFAQSLLYSCYAFEYLWRSVSGDSFDKFLINILNCWPYYVGYGSVIGVTLTVIPDTFGWSGLVLSLAYPILVIGALSVSWNPAQSKPPPQSLFFRLLRLPIGFSSYPPLIATKLVIYVFGKLIPSPKQLAKPRQPWPPKRLAHHPHS